MRISIPAWINSHYVSLAELLLLIGQYYPEKDWLVRVEEVAPEPGCERLEAIDANVPMQLWELQGLVKNDVQLVDGEVTARDHQGMCLRLTAVDSTSWDVETNYEIAILTLFREYPNAIGVCVD